MGQDGDRFDVRLRTTKTSTNGIPSLSTNPKTLQTKLTHIVYTHGRGGQTRMYVDGRQRADKTIPGSVTNWDGSFRLALANELTGDRPWEGIFYLVAIYNRDLSPARGPAEFPGRPGCRRTNVVGRK